MGMPLEAGKPEPSEISQKASPEGATVKSHEDMVEASAYEEEEKESCSKVPSEKEPISPNKPRRDE